MLSIMLNIRLITSYRNYATISYTILLLLLIQVALGFQ